MPGIQWNPAEDKLTLDLSPTAEQDSRKLTKQKMLKLLAKNFDPLGLGGPAVDQGRVAIQEAYKILKEWDTEVPDEVKGKWKDGKEAFVRRIRYMFLDTSYLLRGIKHAMHCFADTSIEAYSVTVYLMCKLHYRAYSIWLLPRQD